MGESKLLDMLFVGPLIIGLLGLAYLFIIGNLIRNFILKL